MKTLLIAAWLSQINLQTHCFASPLFSSFAYIYIYNTTSIKWYYFDTAGPSVQDIYAGRNINIGTVEISEPVDGEVTITLNLKDNWDLQQGEEEVVKIKGYATADLPEKLTGVGIGDVFDTYQGTDLTITVPAYDIFIIHLDVEGTIESEDLPA